MNVMLDIIGLTMIVFSIYVLIHFEASLGDDDTPFLIKFICNAILNFIIMLPIVSFGYLGWFLFNK